MQGDPPLHALLTKPLVLLPESRRLVMIVDVAPPAAAGHAALPPGVERRRAPQLVSEMLFLPPLAREFSTLRSCLFDARTEPTANLMEIAKLVKTALEETRMLILGAQILLPFEFSGVFRNGFMALPSHVRYLDGIALWLMIVTTALLIAPETYHHYVENNADSGRFHQLISRMAGGALLPFALSLGVALAIIGETIGVR
jgi:Family of unknown function (DUF6328)